MRRASYATGATFQNHAAAPGETGGMGHSRHSAIRPPIPPPRDHFGALRQSENRRPLGPDYRQIGVEHAFPRERVTLNSQLW
jgi:hypothetical protein